MMRRDDGTDRNVLVVEVPPDSSLRNLNQVGPEMGTLKPTDTDRTPSSFVTATASCCTILQPSGVTQLSLCTQSEMPSDDPVQALETRHRDLKTRASRLVHAFAHPSMRTFLDGRTRELRDAEALLARKGGPDGHQQSIHVLLDIAERYIESLEGILATFGPSFKMHR